MTTPTLPVRALNAGRTLKVVTERRAEPVDPASEVGPLKWCWQCRRHLDDAEFPDPGVRCCDCRVTSSRVNAARLAVRFLHSERPASVRRLVAYRAMASAVTAQAALLGIDLTDCPIPDPTGVAS